MRGATGTEAVTGNAVHQPWRQGQDPRSKASTSSAERVGSDQGEEGTHMYGIYV